MNIAAIVLLQAVDLQTNVQLAHFLLLNYV